MPAPILISSALALTNEIMLLLDLISVVVVRNHLLTAGVGFPDSNNSRFGGWVLPLRGTKSAMVRRCLGSEHEYAAYN